MLDRVITVERCIDGMLCPAVPTNLFRRPAHARRRDQLTNLTSTQIRIVHRRGIGVLREVIVEPRLYGSTGRCACDVCAGRDTLLGMRIASEHPVRVPDALTD